MAKFERDKYAELAADTEFWRRNFGTVYLFWPELTDEEKKGKEKHETSKTDVVRDQG